jgi:hypothetical protein
MMTSLCFVYFFPCGDLQSPTAALIVDPSLPERILFHADEISGVVLGRRVWATALGTSELFHARAKHQG